MSATRISWAALGTAATLAGGAGCTAVLGYDDRTLGGGRGAIRVSAGCTPAEASEAVSDGCGVFVAAKSGDDDAGNGTK
ncbi:MAG: hypothetical protein R3F14_27735 [Polyangiaceae bacterium]